MTDIMMARLQELMVVLYAISLVFYFIDYLYKNTKANRIAFWIVSAVWVMQTSFIILFIIETHRFPILSLFEGIYFYVWILVTTSIFLHCIFKVDLPVFFLNVIGFIFMTIHTFAPSQITASTVGHSLVSELLFIHVSFAILSYGAFSLSFVFSTLYLILYRVLKQKKWTKQWTRLPSLQQTEQGMSVAILTGIPLLMISLILGVQWAYIKLSEFSILDVKIAGSFVLLLIYCFILFYYRKGKLRGTNYAWLHVYAFLLLILNFILGSRLSEFHYWY